MSTTLFTNEAKHDLMSQGGVLMNKPLRICVLTSGSGSTFEAVVRAANEYRHLGLAVVGHIASKLSAGSLQRARLLGFTDGDTNLVLNPRDFPSRDIWGEAIINACQRWRIDIIAQLGWLKLTPPNVLAAFSNRVINQHPAPLDPGYPDFGGQGMFGRAAHATRLLYVRMGGMLEPWTEATVHFTNAEYDGGALIATQRVLIEPKDDVEMLAKRVLPVEHALVISTLATFANGRARPVQRDKRLVPTDRLTQLSIAKEHARYLFPNG